MNFCLTSKQLQLHLNWAKNSSTCILSSVGERSRCIVKFNVIHNFDDEVVFIGTLADNLMWRNTHLNIQLYISAQEIVAVCWIVVFISATYPLSPGMLWWSGSWCTAQSWLLWEELHSSSLRPWRCLLWWEVPQEERELPVLWKQVSVSKSLWCGKVYFHKPSVIIDVSVTRMRCYVWCLQDCYSLRQHDKYFGIGNKLGPCRKRCKIKEIGHKQTCPV